VNPDEDFKTFLFTFKKSDVSLTRKILSLGARSGDPRPVPLDQCEPVWHSKFEFEESATVLVTKLAVVNF
jgi:hypothetical protein